MFKPISAFSGFSVNNIAEAQEFYGKTLGLDVRKAGAGLRIHLPGSSETFMYPKSDHKPATYTMLNLVVEDIDVAVKDLKQQGIVFERYNNWQGDDLIMRGLANNRGPDIAWFKDPAGNILAVLQEA